MSRSTVNVTQLLVNWSAGDQGALEKLMPVVYEELRRLARAYMRRERREHTLQTTALVHEVFLRLVDQRSIHWQNRTHFFGIAAQLMRRVLVDHARKHSYAKRKGGVRLTLGKAIDVSADRAAELVALDDSLMHLATIDERKSRVVELRYFGGLSIEETAEVLGVGSATVKRDWRMAKAWLYQEVRIR